MTNDPSGGVTQSLQKEVLEIPNLNRYGFANATLMPAIQQSEERRETINASVAGNTSNRNAFYIDGAEATDPWRGWSPRQPVVDAFEEIVVNTAGATVDVGSNFGGTYNAIFKSGTNQFHGSAWYFFRDSGLNANSWSNNRVGLKKPDDPLKYWGGQVGGPIIKDKLFFYLTGSRETDQTPYSHPTMESQPVTALQQSNGIQVRADRAWRDGKRVNVDVCYTLLNASDWSIWGATLQYAGTSITDFGSALLSLQEPVEGQSGLRCDTLSFINIPPDADLSNVSVTIDAIAAPPRAEEYCSIYMPKIQQALSERGIAITLDCPDLNGVQSMQIMSKPDSMSQEEAERIVYSDEFYTVKGSWSFTFNLGQ